MFRGVCVWFAGEIFYALADVTESGAGLGVGLGVAVFVFVFVSMEDHG
jgi:hypothetical protein